VPGNDHSDKTFIDMGGDPMSTVVSPPAEATASGKRIRDVRGVERVAAAVVLIVSGSCLTASRFLTPDGTETPQILASVAANPGRQFGYALLTYLAGATMVPAFLAAARLARTRRPLLAMIAVAVNLVAYLGGATLGAVETLYLAGARLPKQQQGGAAAAIDQFWATGLVSFSSLLFTFGTLAGGVLMGLALRGRIPILGWVAIAASQPVLFAQWALLSNGSGVGLDAAARGLLALGFVICAVTVLRMTNDNWDLTPRQVRGPQSSTATSWRI
jgi:hypothetical protein